MIQCNLLPNLTQYTPSPSQEDLRISESDVSTEDSEFFCESSSSDNSV